MSLPKDPVILVSYLNTQLRDFYSTFSAFCEDKEVSAEEITETLADYGYQYRADINQFA